MTKETYEQAGEYLSLTYQLINQQEAKDLRQKCGLTLKEVADLVGHGNASMIHKWEKNAVYPALQNQIDYGRVLKSMREKAGVIAQ